jgi:SAM-dependent methyltransferase
LHAARADLRAAFPVLDSAGFWQWLATHGVLEDARVARAHPPLPPAELRATACGGVAPASHLYTGAEDFRVLAELFAAFVDRPVAGVASVLDFGCGPGRVLRWFQQALPNAHLAGVDVRAAQIAWCREHLRGDFHANDVLPPLPFAEGTFELTYALSVFSHLALDQNLAWIRELARVTRPDGLILLSTHGAFAAVICARSPEHQELLQIGPDEARSILRRLAPETFVHRVLPQHVLAAADGVADDYGQAFFTETFARREWADTVDYVGCVPCALGLFQDVYVLRPRR